MRNTSEIKLFLYIENSMDLVRRWNLKFDGDGGQAVLFMETLVTLLETTSSNTE